MFQCFKPVNLGDDRASMVDRKHRRYAKYIDPRESLMRYVSVRVKKGLVFPAKLSSYVTSEKHTEDAEKNEDLAGEELYEDSERKIVTGRERHLRRVCRQVFLRVSCQKNMTEAKSKFRRKHSKHEEDTKKLKGKPLLTGDPQSDSNVSSSSRGPWSGFSSSTTSCSTTSSPSECLLSSSQRSNQSRDENLNKHKGQGQRCRGFTFGLCTILVTLLVLVLWGKTCSVLCTCMWFFLVPHINVRCKVSKAKRFELSEEVLSSEGYKKRIVMEGLLRRDQRCV